MTKVITKLILKRLNVISHITRRMMDTSNRHAIRLSTIDDLKQPTSKPMVFRK